jgi:hypothetical protein
VTPPYRIRSYVNYFGVRKWQIWDARDHLCGTFASWEEAMLAAERRWLRAW